MRVVVSRDAHKLINSLCLYFDGGDLLCGTTGTVLGPGFGVLGFFLGIGAGGERRCGVTGTVLVIALFFSDVLI
jgi:hypothetical protein